MDTGSRVIIREHHSTIWERKFSRLLSNGYNCWIASLKISEYFRTLRVIVARVHWRRDKNTLVAWKGQKFYFKRTHFYQVASFERIFFSFENKKFREGSRKMSTITTSTILLSRLTITKLLISLLYNRCFERYNELSWSFYLINRINVNR